MKTIKILHIITGLKVGGAENALHRLIVNSPKNFHHEVLCLTSGGEMHSVFLSSKIKVTTIDFKKSFFSSMYFLIRLIRSKRPDIVQTWLYHANFIGGIAARLSGVNIVIWGLRGTAIPQSVFSTNNFAIKLGAFFSYFIPSSIICNAQTVRKFHLKKMYCKNKIEIIENGFNLKKDKSTKEVLLSNIKVRHHKALLIGTVGRYDKLKDYPNMINALSIIMEEFTNVHFIMVGRGLDNSNTTLMSLLSDSLDISRVHLLGEKNNISSCLVELDIFCLSSRNEGFPNVLAEAMLMKIPCVATDAGDSSSLVSNIGILVPVEDHIKLALGLKCMIEEGDKKRKEIGEISYSHIESNYSIEKNISKFSSLYMKLINEK
jgi:glycosyltransferase involved in cell wall biosynthesis